MKGFLISVFELQQRGVKPDDEGFIPYSHDYMVEFDRDQLLASLSEKVGPVEMFPGDWTERELQQAQEYARSAGTEVPQQIVDDKQRKSREFGPGTMFEITTGDGNSIQRVVGRYWVRFRYEDLPQCTISMLTDCARRAVEGVVTEFSISSKKLF